MLGRNLETPFLKRPEKSGPPPLGSPAADIVKSLLQWNLA